MIEMARGARARLAAAALVLLAIWEVMVLTSARAAAPSDADWKAVAAALPATLGDDRLVVFAPRWIDPIGRLWLGGRMSIEQAARMDAVPYREVWEVSLRGATAPEVAKEPPVSEQRFGPIRVRRFVRDAPTVTWRLTGETRICEIDFEPRRALVLELHGPSAEARRAFTHVELGNQLQLYTGLADYEKRSVNQSKAVIVAAIDGREVTRGVAGNDDGWVALPMARTLPGPHDLEIVALVQNQRGTVDMPVCVAAEARMSYR